MARPKSLLVTAKVESAKRAHDCQHNPKHRLQMGDKRLTVKKKRGRGVENFCASCSFDMIRRDIEKLKRLADELS